MLEKNEQLWVAIDIAIHAHDMQLDKGGMLYVLHPLHVMDTVEGIDAKIVAVLHDVIEDTETTLENLAAYEFPQEILDAIDAITKRKGEKKEAYWARVKANPLATRVKLADIAHNTSEARLAALSEDERQYLKGKYAKALAFLKS
jgi:(p)ppGpp synthase/HD superfamily hydrolase